MDPRGACTDCATTIDVDPCTVCQRLVCPRHRSGTGRLADGYQCMERDCWHVGYPPRRHEAAVCELFTNALKLTYPDRRIVVTPAPLSDVVPEDIAVQFDRSGVVDVVIGPLDANPAWAAFRCDLQSHVRNRDWPGAISDLLEKASTEIGRWRASSEEVLKEAARRANWDAQQGPDHLRTGRFNPRQ